MLPWQERILDKINSVKTGEMTIMMTGRQVGKSMLQQQIIDQQAKTMAEEMDREILWGMLVDIGWHRIMISRSQDNNHAIDITHWLAENCQGAYERSGRDFIFEAGKDATAFALRWA